MGKIMQPDVLKGKNAVITGSTSGIGLGMARALADSGANVMINGLGDAGEIEATRAAIQSDYAVTALYDGANMMNGDEITAMVRRAEAELGSVDILINNAGIQFVSAIDEFPADKWEAIISINMVSNFHAIKAALPGMKARNQGRIINLASAHGLVASPFKSAYVAAKHGVLGLTKSVALEIAETGITCNAICPGYVRTPLVDGQIRDQAKAHNMSEEQVIRDVILAAQPNKRFVEVEELGQLAVFLCTDAAQSFNGASLPVEGGWTAR
ncbi:3-hydroxybutyrate dehydrogenase [Emcibacter sp.]|uniref:3-hydroxybutyrate dehydrogenase n=1 Tax=Emcibacter sp. TaxID=1979954 RepID=UPI002AA90B85|nr:3-hydroxybutyrate dehydrogenase [Emcibacter sp.]